MTKAQMLKIPGLIELAAVVFLTFFWFGWWRTLGWMPFDAAAAMITGWKIDRIWSDFAMFPLLYWGRTLHSRYGRYMRPDQKRPYALLILVSAAVLGPLMGFMMTILAYVVLSTYYESAKK